MAPNGARIYNLAQFAHNLIIPLRTNEARDSSPGKAHQGYARATVTGDEGEGQKESPREASEDALGRQMGGVIVASLVLILAFWCVDWLKPRPTFRLSPMGVKYLILWAIAAMILFAVKC